MSRPTHSPTSLNTRVALAMAVVFMGFVTVLAWLDARYFETEYRNSLSRQQFALVSALAQQIDDKLRQTQEALAVSAQQLPRTALSNPDLTQQHLDRMAVLRSIFDNGVTLISAQGRLIAESPYRAERRGRDMQAGEFFETITRTHKPHISKPFMSTRSPGQPAVVVSVPLFDAQGALEGILQGSFDLLGQNVLANLSKTRIGETGHLSLLTRDRLIITHSQPMRIMSPAPQPGENALLDRALAGFEGSGPSHTAQGHAILSSYKRLNSTDWLLSAHLPVAEADAPLQRARLYFWLAALVTATLVLLLVCGVMRRLLAPLASLTHHVQTLPDKTGTERLLPVTGSREIATLTQATNDFVQTIDHQQQTLRDSEARFRSLIDLSTDWYWEQDTEFRFTHMSVALVRQDLLSLIGLRRWDLPTEGVSQAQWADHQRALAQHKPFKDFVYQIRASSGELHAFSISGTPVFDAQGRFTGYRGIGRDITDRMTAEQRIQFLAYHDPLTELPNRLLLQDRFEQAVAQAQRNGSRVALLYLDLDSFKSINDTLGHQLGDTLLKEVAQRLKHCVRETDTISRQGGDEFLVLLRDLPDTDVAAAIMIKIAEKLQTPFLPGVHDILTSASIGAAIFPEDGRDFENMLKKADMAMYRAKEAGRNTYRFFDEAMNAEAVSHLQLLGGLRHALERQELTLHYQPQIDVASGGVVGVEALLRWKHPDLGVVDPCRFIPVAEESGLIVPIGQWVLNEACHQAMAWQRAGLPPLVMAVNFSAVQFKRGDVEHSVVQALQASGLAPTLLELELTESILIQDVDSVLTSLKYLKQLGVQLSIDDFGTGYSSLAYLKRFDIDRLKIDRTFVCDLASDPEDAAIVRAIIQMAHNLNLRTIAEGVETPAMLARLQAYGCDEVQGYLFGSPMPAHEMERFLRARHAHPDNETL